jgi:ubiquinone/menaquinone biosynthesis C-methylase UbiE
VIGGDVSGVGIGNGRTEAEQQGIENIEFRVEDAYELPFKDESFDAVWSSSMFEYLSDKEGALAEMRRVLKPGGVIGVQGTDWRGRIAGSSSPDATPDAADERYREISYQSFLRRGVDFHFGTQLPRLLKEGGFVLGDISAVYMKAPAAGPVAIFETVVLPEENISYLEESGLATRDDIQAMAAHRELRAQYPGAFAFLPLVCVVAWKE